MSTSTSPPKLVTLADLPDVVVPPELHWEGPFDDYLSKCAEHPPTVCTAHQRLYGAMTRHGKDEYTFLRDKVVRWRIFDDPFTSNHKYAIYGRNVEIALMNFMKVLQAASRGLGQEQRTYLLCGSVGTAKSTLAELCGLALEDFSKTSEGQLFSPYWEVESGDQEGMEILGTLTQKFENTRLACPLHEEPLQVLSPEYRQAVLDHLNGKIDLKQWPGFEIKGNPCPICDAVFDKFLRRYKYDWRKVIDKHLRVQRFVISKRKRHGVAAARPKSEKDQDVTEFLGSTNFAKLGAYGSMTDPRTFDFNGHFMASNRGLLYYEEELKFALAFLYDLLGATQEGRVQPRGFMEIDVDEVIIGSTNEPEYKKLMKDETMEALRDRTIPIRVPYILKLSDEVKIYTKFFTPKKQGGKHMAPRTLYLASYWAVLTRLAKSTKSNLDLRDKLKLYDGRTVPGFNEDSIRELMQEEGAAHEGHVGISPRYIHDKISGAFTSPDDKECINFFSVMRELKEGLKDHQHLKSNEERENYEKLIVMAKQELQDCVATDIQEAATEGEEEMVELFTMYIDHVMAASHKEQIRDPITNEYVDPNKQLMEDIESKIGITDHEDFRQKVLNQMAKRSLDVERNPKILRFDYRSDERLYRALRLYRFDQVKQRINWERLLSRKAVADPSAASSDLTEHERMVDRVKQNLMTMKFGPEQESYCAICAAESLNYFAAVFSQAKKKEGKGK